MGRSWSGLGWSWGHLGPILGHLGQAWGDLEPAGGTKNVDFPNVFQYFFAISHFRIRMVILAGLEAFLGPLGTSLGRSWDFWWIFGAPRELRSTLNPAEARHRSPPLPKLIANSDYTTAKLLTANC